MTHDRACSLPRSKLLLSISEAAEILSISRRTVENLLARRDLESRKIGSRRLIVRASLERLGRQRKEVQNRRRGIETPEKSMKSR